MVQLRKHLGKGLWAAADKAMPLVYGIVNFAVVITHLSKESWAAFALFNVLFLVVSQLGDTIILQPMVKFCAEPHHPVSQSQSAALLLFTLFFAAFALIISYGGNVFGLIFGNGELSLLLPMMWIILATNLLRNFMLRVFQITYRIETIFIVDAVFFGVLVTYIIVSAKTGNLNHGDTVVWANIWAGAASSVTALLFSRRSLSLTVKLRASSFTRFFHIGKYQSGTALLNIVQTYADVILVAFMAPFHLAAYNVSKTLFRGFEALRDAGLFFIVPASSKWYERGDREHLRVGIEKIFLLLMAGFLPLAVILSFASPAIFHFMYGGKYDDAGTMFTWLALGAIGMPAIITGGGGLLGIGHARELFLTTLAGTMLYLTLNIILIPYYGGVGAAITFAAVTIGMGFLQFSRLGRELKFSLKAIIVVRGASIKEFFTRGDQDEEDSDE